MEIRRAEPRDIDGVLRLLHQVLEVHAALRPDMFVSGTTKYSAEELENLFRDDTHPVYVAVDEVGRVLGHAFCAVQEPNGAAAMAQYRSLYIDDICVDEAARGQHIATKLFEHVKKEAGRLGCYDMTLNVWTGNTGAEKFYEAMGMKPLKTTLRMVLD